jgi:hypothetical protein
MNKNALITALLVLLLLAGITILQLWSNKTAPVEKTSAPVVTKVAAPAPEPPALVPASLPVSTPAPVAPMSDRDKRLIAGGLKPGSEVHGLSVHTVAAPTKKN